VGAEEERREREDEDQAGKDEADAANETAAHAAKAPSAVDRQLSGSRPGQQVRRGDRVLELLGVDPFVLLDAEPAKEGDMRWRSSEADAAESRPLARDGDERDLVARARTVSIGGAGDGVA
jgi:hypothetical protein